MRCLSSTRRRCTIGEETNANSLKLWSSLLKVTGRNFLPSKPTNQSLSSSTAPLGSTTNVVSQRGERSNSVLGVTVASKKVTAWYRPKPFDMEHVYHFVHSRGIHIKTTFPGIHHNQVQQSGLSVGVTSVGAMTGMMKEDQPISPIHDGGKTSSNVTNDDSAVASMLTPASSKGMPQEGTVAAILKQPPVPPHVLRGLEMLTFTIAGPSSAQRPSTFVIFADGGIVGWDATWEEMLALRTWLEKDSYKMHSNVGKRSMVSTSQLIELTLETLWGKMMGHQSSIGSSAAVLDTLIVDSMPYDTHENVVAPHDHKTNDETVSRIDARNDRIILENDDDEACKLAFSVALAQSVKLDALEASLTPILKQVKEWQVSLWEKGGVTCSVKALRRTKTQLLFLSEVLNFKQNIATTPKMFWSGQFQSLRPIYREAFEHLEIEERGEGLKTRIETVDESVSYLHDETHAIKMEFLTWVIIWLIAAEIAIALGAPQRLYQAFSTTSTDE